MNKFLHILTPDNEYFIRIKYITTIEHKKNSNTYWINTTSDSIKINPIQYRFLRANIYRIDELASHGSIKIHEGLCEFEKILDAPFTGELRLILHSRWIFVKELLYVKDDEFLDIAWHHCLNNNEILEELKETLWNKYEIILGELA